MLAWMRASGGNQLLAPRGRTGRSQGAGRGRAIPADSEPKRQTHPCWPRKPNATILQCKYQPCPSSWLRQSKTFSHPDRLCIPREALSIYPTGSESRSPGTAREISSIPKQREAHYQKLQPARSFGNKNMQLLQSLAKTFCHEAQRLYLANCIYLTISKSQVSFLIRALT